MDEICNEAFETLKGILVKIHVLKLPNFEKILKSTSMPLMHPQAFLWTQLRVQR